MARYYPSRNDIDKPDKLERVVRDIYDRLYKGRSVTSTSTTTPVESGGGAPGPVGPQGPAGPAGAKGDKGDTGPQGEKGDTGDGGATIVWVGDQISANGVLGPSLTGPAGPAGADGAAGATGPQGPQGVQGIQGIQGIQGDPGEGVPAAGTTGQVLTKTSDTDYDTEWADPTGSSLPAGGTTGQVLAKASDADDDVEWVDQSGGGGGGGLVLLYSVEPIGVSYVDITSVFSSLYFEYLIRLSGMASSAGETGVNAVVSGDNGATWDNAANYSWVREYQSYGNSGYENHFNNGTFFRLCGCPPSGLGRGQSDVVLYNPQMSGGCSIKAEAFNQGGDNRLYWDHIIGRYISTATINALKIFLSSGNYSSGSIRVYGYQR